MYNQLLFLGNLGYAELALLSFVFIFILLIVLIPLCIIIMLIKKRNKKQ